MRIMDVSAANGVPFRVLLIDKREAGPNEHRTPAGRALDTVEFFDRRHAFSEHGQFTGGSYYTTTLLLHTGPLALYGSEESWRIDADTVALVREWIRHNARPCPSCSGAGMVPAGGWEPDHMVTDGYVTCLSCTVGTPEDVTA